ncbi:MAG: alanine--tRNA ligase-related protein, partial [Candidatus Woesearchaeota archaeon]
LVIPQFCLRFPDIDNVGITGHYVGFVMMGEHAFVPPEKYDTNSYLRHHLMWLNEGMGLPSEELTIHEDVWAGGGNFGPCLEFFSRGLEISNQVYMQYEHTTSGIKELKIKVLDMGQGQERAAWFTQGLANSYEASFPEVIKKLRKITGIGYDEKLMSQFAQYSPYLNVNEAKDINAAWASVAERLGIDLKELTSIVQ